ncbi:MAG: phosphatidylserine/phosphatidylglycerophosphate/cardiolipin synthase family protein [Chryseobacterium gambrini]|nr:phosphatidylserine/phosphatidylglycerophosphate/cardiolipin synthase family protein [Chryseobacterium gambrini]
MGEMIFSTNDILKKGFFIVNSNYKQSEANFYENLFLTHKENCTLKDRIIATIREAEKVIKICSFVITDNEIVSEIIEKAKNPNFAIFILTMLDKNRLTNKISLDSDADEEDFPFKDIDSHLNNIKKLRDHGVHIRAAESVHAKFMIADRNEGIITSANFTTNSLSHNVESGVYMDSESSKALDRLFDAIYLNGAPYKSFITTKQSKKMFITKVNAGLIKENLNFPYHNLRFTYSNLHNGLFDEILNIINNAEDFIYLSSYSIIELAMIESFVKAISEAIERGVQISIFCRAMNRLDHIEGCRKLSRKGCKIFAECYNHSKGIVSEKNGMIFTANIDGKHGLINGFEIGYILNEDQKEEFLKFHKELISMSIFRFENTPVRSSFMEFIALYEMEKNQNPISVGTDLELIVNKSLQKYFHNISDSLIFIGNKREKDRKISFIQIDNEFYETTMNYNKIKVLRKCKSFFDAEKYLLKYKNLKVIFSDEQ